jgi:CheY-like chemotaxis protein
VGETLRILVAEDDENDLVLLRVAFSKGHLAAPLNVVRDGQELMDYLEGVPPFDDRVTYPQPTLLLLDLSMPRRDGFEVLEWLLWYPKLRPKHIVVLTASDYGEDLRRVKLLGADAHLVKPQDMNELVRLVKWLEQYWLDAEKVEQAREFSTRPD